MEFNRAGKKEKNMRRMGLFLVAVIMCLFFASSQTSAAGLPVGMTSLTFDDGVDSLEMQSAFEKMIANGIPGTTYLVPYWIDSSGTVKWSFVRYLYEKGWEIGNHTMNHKHPTALTTNFSNEVKLAQQAFLKRGIMNANSFAIPYGEGYKLVNGKVVLNTPLLSALNSLGFITTSRQAFTGDNPTILNDVASFNTMAIRVFSWKGTTNEAYINALIDQTVFEKKFLVLVVHEVSKYPNPSDNDQISLDMFLRVCDKMKILADQGLLLTMTVSQGAGRMVYYKQLP